jgi:hypothetical protein
MGLMALTKRTITHVFSEASGAAASGAVEFTLTGRLTQNGKTVVPSSVTSALNAAGELSQELTSNVDAETVPQDTRYRVDFRMVGEAPESFYIVVPTGPGTTDLGSLLPKQPQGG